MSYDPESNRIEIAPAINKFIESRAGSPLTIFSGANNTGKSLILKNIAAAMGKDALLLGTNRFSMAGFLSGGTQDQYYDFDGHYRSLASISGVNNEVPLFIQLDETIKRLDDAERASLLHICGELLGSKISIKSTNPNNEFSHKYIDIDGQNLSAGSTG